MNPLNEHQQAVFDTVKKFPHIGIEMIGKISQIKNRLYLIKVLKDLCALGRLSVEIENGDPGYTIVDEANEIAAKTKTTPLGSNGEHQEKGMRPASTGRDTGKYIFEGNSYGKGRLVWAVVKAWLDANKKIQPWKNADGFP
jgi:hypothetical protein